MIPSIKKLAENLRALGIREDGILLVHASLRSLGNIEGGAETIIRVLLEILGEGGTLLLPALSYETVRTANPYFDVRNTPSCVGALPEYFRQREGTLRSIHPTHSVCGVGVQARELLSGHEKDTTPCGPNSPFHKLPHYKGQILFLGCGLQPNTSMHAIEELVEPPYLFSGFLEYEITGADGHVSIMTIHRHNFKGWVQRYDRLAQVLDKNDLRTDKILDARCHLIEAKAMWPAVYEKLKADPLFFVDREGDENA